MSFNNYKQRPEQWAKLKFVQKEGKTDMLTFVMPIIVRMELNNACFY